MGSKRIRLVSSDGKNFEVEKRVVLESLTIMKKLHYHHYNDNHNSPVVLDEIDGETLEKVIKYCEIHDVPYSNLDDEAVVNSLHAFDAAFVNVDETTFFTLIQAAYYLKIKPLMNLTCGTLSKKFKGKRYKEIGEVIEKWKQNAD